MPDEIDQRLVNERVAQFRGQTQRFLAGELTEDQFRPLRLQNGLYMQLHATCCASPFRTACCSRQMRISRTSRATTTAATGISPRARTCSSTGPSWKRFPKFSRTGDGADARDPDQRQLHPQHHHRSVRRRRAATRSWTRGRVPKSCGSGRPSIPSSPTCRASSRSRSPARRTGPRGGAACTTSVCACSANAEGEVGFRVLAGGGLGRTPVIGTMIRELLPMAAPAHVSRGDFARLQPLRRPGQQVQGAHQDPGARRSASTSSRAEVEAEWEHLEGRRLDADAEEIERVAAASRRPAYKKLDAARDRLRAGAAQATALRATGSRRNVRAHKVPGYAAVTLSLKTTGVPPGDVHGRADGRDRGPCGPLQLRRAARNARTESRCSPTCGNRILRSYGSTPTRSDSPRPTSG